MAGHGGSRTGAGRPKGAKDRIPRGGKHPPDKNGLRQCSICVQWKPVAEYLKNWPRACGSCYRAWRRTPERLAYSARAAYRTHLKKNFGITLEQYESMLQSQNFACAICRTTDPGKGNAHFSVDHDHQTNAIRGLLCDNCNHGLGNFKDDISRLQEAIRYLEQHRTH